MYLSGIHLGRYHKLAGLSKSEHVSFGGGWREQALRPGAHNDGVGGVGVVKRSYGAAVAGGAIASRTGDGHGNVLPESF